MDNSTFDKYDNITSQNYILNCKSNETFKSYLQIAIQNLFYFKNNNKLGASCIIAIIIPIIFVIGLILILLAYLKKK